MPNASDYHGESAMERAEVLHDLVEPRRLSRRERLEADPDSARDDDLERESDD